jgi:hypothetical protein
MKLSEDHPAVARGCISLMAPICTLILADRHHLALALPALGMGLTMRRFWLAICSDTR